MEGGTKIVALEKVEKGGSPGNAVTSLRKHEAMATKLRRIISAIVFENKDQTKARGTQ